jgi:hypothetical protein
MISIPMVEELEISNGVADSCSAEHEPASAFEIPAWDGVFWVGPRRRRSRTPGRPQEARQSGSAGAWDCPRT